MLLCYVIDFRIAPIAAKEWEQMPPLPSWFPAYANPTQHHSKMHDTTPPDDYCTRGTICQLHAFFVVSLIVFIMNSKKRIILTLEKKVQ